MQTKPRKTPRSQSKLSQILEALLKLPERKTQCLFKNFHLPRKTSSLEKKKKTRKATLLTYSTREYLSNSLYTRCSIISLDRTITCPRWILITARALFPSRFFLSHSLPSASPVLLLFYYILD